jgi:hypothetical protein
MMKITNNHNLPDVVVQALTHDTYSKGRSNRSVTQLIDSPRIGVLYRQNEQHIEKDAVEFLWTRLGTSVHDIFEQAVKNKENVASEERIFVKFHDWIISGAIDLQETTPDGIDISDYKVTSVWSVIFGKEEWHNQLNAYSWLVRHGKAAPVNKLNIICVMRDWQRRKAQEDSNYPQSPVEVIPIPRWSDEEKDEYMLKRIQLHQEAEMRHAMGDTLPFCTDKERWKRDDKFAVKKKNVQRATKVFDYLEDAESFVEKNSNGIKYFVEHRKGEPTRCVQDWCKVSQFCDQFNGESR